MDEREDDGEFDHGPVSFQSFHETTGRFRGV
jgi:hypothetical protein